MRVWLLLNYCRIWVGLFTSRGWINLATSIARFRLFYCYFVVSLSFIYLFFFFGVYIFIKINFKILIWTIGICKITNGLITVFDGIIAEWILSFLKLIIFFILETLFLSKAEQRLRSTNVDIHKSRDNIYLSCAFLIS